MTKVQIYKTRDGKYRSFTCQGHTDYSTAGSDIVCAGVSAIVISTINSLQDLLHEDVHVDYDAENGGDITLNVNKDLSEKGQFLIDHMIYGLEWIGRQYNRDGRRYLDYQVSMI